MIDIVIEIIEALLNSREQSKQRQQGKPIRRPQPGGRQARPQQPGAQGPQPTRARQSPQNPAGNMGIPLGNLEEILQSQRPVLEQQPDPGVDPYRRPMAELYADPAPPPPEEPDRKGYQLPEEPERVPDTIEAKHQKIDQLSSLRTELRDPKALRKAFILNEILQPPVSLRG